MVKKEKDYKVVAIHNELLEILDEQGDKIQEYSRGAIQKVSYVVKSLALARKIKGLK